MSAAYIAAVILMAGAQLSVGQNLTDQEFVDRAGQANMTEAHAGKLALQKGASQDIRTYGARIETDHKNAYQKLSSVASGVKVPDAIDASHRKIIDELERLSGAEFDNRFKQVMIADHQKTIEMFERAANQLTDTNLKNYASQMLPSLREHLQEAQNLRTDETSRSSSTTAVPAAAQQATSTAATGTTAAQAGKTESHFGTVTKYEKDKTLELKVRDRVGRHTYDLGSTTVSGPLPGDLRVGSTVQVTEAVDQNGHRTIRIENASDSVRSRSEENTNPKP